MPDALNIVLPVVQDVTEDQGDKMDIDSSNVKKAR